MTQINVKKRDGSLQPWEDAKINQVVIWAAEGLDVSASQVILGAKLKITDGVETKELHEALVQSAADLISLEKPDYSKLAARLLLFSIRKEAYGSYEPPRLGDHVLGQVAADRYCHTLLEMYTVEELNELDKYIDHSRDLDIGYSGMVQLETKYLVQNRVTDTRYESPQILYMLVGATLFGKYPEPMRTELVKDFYDAASLQEISLPTPIMAGVRTSTRQFSSCVLIEIEDSIRGIGAATTAVMQYIAMRAGIGFNFGGIRAKGSAIRDGSVKHTGITQFLHVLQAAVGSCAQGGVRKGSATAFYPFWHRDAEDFLVLKNNRGTDEQRARHLDYGFQVNRLIMERAVAGKDLTLFSPSEVPGLWDLFYSDDYEGFKALYEEYEANPMINGKKVNAYKLLETYLTERAQTGRYYYHDVFWTNKHTPFDCTKAPIRQSNLCLEIALPTKPLGANVDDPDAEIALCTLSAFNLLKIKTPEQFLRNARIVTRVLDELLDYQDYPMAAAKNSTELYRPLGVGVVNFAAALAEQGFKYGDQNCLDYTHRTFELLQYSLMTASVELAKEKGRCKGFDNLNLAKGQLLIDSYCKNVDQLTSEPLHCDWESLRADILEHGIRNSTLTAMMPSETSSQVLGATNGIEPVRSYVVAKDSKHGIMRQVIPNPKLAENYTIAWEMGDCLGYLSTVAVMQKFTDQAISANTYDDPAQHPGGQTPIKVLLQQIAHSMKYGLKTLYYHNTREKSEDNNEIIFVKEDADCGGGGCKI